MGLVWIQTFLWYENYFRKYFLKNRHRLPGRFPGSPKDIWRKIWYHQIDLFPSFQMRYKSFLGHGYPNSWFSNSMDIPFILITTVPEYIIRCLLIWRWVRLNMWLWIVKFLRNHAMGAISLRFFGNSDNGNLRLGTRNYLVLVGKIWEF